jgi:hypothetical protein
MSKTKERKYLETLAAKAGGVALAQMTAESEEDIVRREISMKWRNGGGVMAK